MSLSKEIEKLKFDKRLTDWQVSRGRLAKADLKKHLDSLPDLASNVEHVRFPEDGAGTNHSNGGAGFGSSSSMQ